MPKILCYPSIQLDMILIEMLDFPLLSMEVVKYLEHLKVKVLDEHV